MTSREIHAIRQVITVNADIVDLYEKRGVTRKQVEEICLMAANVAETPGVLAALTRAGYYYSIEHDNFYCVKCHRGVGICRGCLPR